MTGDREKEESSPGKPAGGSMSHVGIMPVATTARKCMFM